MVVGSFKFLIIAFLTASLFSCSSPSVVNNKVSRIPAATKNCLELVQEIVEKGEDSKKVLASAKIDVEEISLSQILASRRALQAKYTQVMESIKDFEMHPDLPVKGKSKIVLNPREGFLAKIMMIRNAKKTIDLSYYIFKDNDTGKALLHELRMAIHRGVKVRIMIDSSGNISSSPFHSDIKSLLALSGRPILDKNGKPTGEYAKAEGMLFNPVINIRAHVANWIKRVHNLVAPKDKQLPLATFTMNRRDHDKILLVDAYSETNSMAIIGGRNIADRYYDINKSEERPIIDAEVIIKGFTQKKTDGTLQNALEDHFNKTYFYLANKNFENFLIKINRDSIRKEYKEMRSSAQKLFRDDELLSEQLKMMESENYLENDFEDGLVSILNEIQNLSRTKIMLAPNGTQNPINGNSIIKRMQDMIGEAQDSIDIVSPYFWISDKEVEIMLSWLLEDPHRKIRIFSNSTASTDNIIAQAMVDKTFQDVILNKLKGTAAENQVELYAYGRIDSNALGGDKKYGLLHSKVFVVDQKKVIISTSNLDPISRHLNSEVGMVLEELPANSKNLKMVLEHIEKTKNDSTVFGGEEWREIQQHPKLKILVVLQSFVSKIIYGLNLVPLI